MSLLSVKITKRALHLVLFELLFVSLQPIFQKKTRVMQKNLVIVESPAKAKTIEKFLGKEYKVMSSYGHVRDLKSKEFSVDIEHGYVPKYVVPTDKKKLVSELKSFADKAECVWLASDEDREGEAISWHLSEVLKLKPELTKRIVFHEITKSAILKAIENPRDIDINLVNAQQARRVLDRIVGFELSPILWRKIKPSLSAGRVQSVSVRLIVEQERQINKFKAKASYRVIANFLLPDGTTILKAELTKRLKDLEEANAFLNSCIKAQFKISDIQKKPVKKSPAAPFTTSTLQQEAARKLGFSVGQTMMVAQHLYEAGLITYMRTDSVNLSNLALATAKETVHNEYGENYYNFRQYHTKSKGAQEAHEAIRPTYIDNATITKGTAQEKRLYELIRKRTLASQMADAQLERTTLTVTAEGINERFTAVGEVMVFDGFLKLYRESSDDEEDNDKESGLLPKVSLSEILEMQEITATERFTQRPSRYTEASLVRRMEELGIGRPSTYAPIIQTIQKRGYVIKGDKEGVERSYHVLALSKTGEIKESLNTETTGNDRNKLMPTDIGLVVNDFLMQYFPSVLEYNFTANVEKDFDRIAEGKSKWNASIDKFYKVFHPMVDKTLAIKTEHKVGERLLGTDPKSNKPVYVKIGRYGPVAQIGDSVDKNGEKNAEKPRFSPLMEGQSIETLELEEAIRLFDLPRTVGMFEDQEMTAAVGRFGPYIKFQGKYVSIPKTSSAMAITEEEAIELIKDKRKKDKERLIKQFDEEPEIQILNGRFGPYISFKKKNYKIPKTIEDPKTLSLEDCQKIIKEAGEKPVRKSTTRRTKKK